MSAVPQELRERMVIELIEAGHSNAEINRRTRSRFGKGVNRDRIAEIRKSRPPVIAFTPEPEPRTALPQKAEPAAPRPDTQFVEQLTGRVTTIVRNGPEAPRIAKIKNVGNPFTLIIADTVDRLLVFRPEDGQKTDYTAQLPEALAADARGDTGPLVKLVTRAAKASRTNWNARTANVGKTVDPTDIDTVKSWACPTTPEADSEVPAAAEAPAELAVHDASADPVPAAVADTDVLAPGDLVEQVAKDEDGNKSFEMSGSFDTSVNLTSTGTLATSADDADLGNGNSRANAAFAAGEEAQLDGRERTDRGDSSNYKRAPKKATGFVNHMARGKGEPTYGEKTLASGGERQTWRQMKEAPRATMLDVYEDLLMMSGLEKLARSLDPAYVDPAPVDYGIGTPRPHDAITLPEPESKPRGSGRVRISGRKESAALWKADIDARTKRLAAKLADDAALAAAERAKALNVDARDAESWARLVKLAAKHGIGEETLLQIKQKTGMKGLDDLLVGLMK
jgi:hypothetical protein